jgi:uncharacterized protein (TIGR02118 family)
MSETSVATAQVSLKEVGGATVLALYKKPADPAAFDAHYANNHAPLAKQLPGLVSYTLGRGGESDPYYLIAILTFESQAALGAALQSELGKKVVADLGNFAQAGVDVLTFPNTAA